MNQSKLQTIEQKIVNLKQLTFTTEGWRVKGHEVVFTNGCFDILHRGHIEVLMQAAEYGQKLVIGLNTDASVKRLKGTNRPINSEMDRALLLASLAYVDAVCLFDEDTPFNLINQIKPDVLVKGGDYSESTIVGADVVKQNGGQIIIIPTLGSYSTTRILEQNK